MPSSVKDRFTVDFETVGFFVKSKRYWFEPQYEKYTAPMNRWGGNKLKADGESTWDKSTKQNTYRNRNMRPHEQGRNKRSVWTITTKPFKGAHFATYPEKLIEPMIKAGCPEFICRKCGVARKKIYEFTGNHIGQRGYGSKTAEHIGVSPTSSLLTKQVKEKIFTELSDCGHNAGWEKGIVLDPFFGSGTTGLVAKKLGRNYLGIELNIEYCKMAEKRLAQEIIKLR